MSTRIKLLQALHGRLGQLFSGEALARRLGISRAAVWKQMQSMKSEGLPIDSTGRLGYVLKAPFDNSLVRFRAAGWIIPHYSLSTSSTQTLAKAGAAAGLAEGHLWIAETQTKARGRLDRAWDSSYGGLWFSLLLRPKLPAARVPPLTLIAGLCLREAVEKVSGVKTKSKWPNDLLVGGPAWKKCAGILTEMSGQMDRTDWVVIGVGLNVNNVIPKGLFSSAASLHEFSGSPAPRAEFLDVFLKVFRDAYGRYQKEGFEPFRRPYWAGYYEAGKTVRLKTADGILSGVARGVDAFGAIMIESRRKIFSISQGEIIL